VASLDAREIDTLDERAGFSPGALPAGVAGVHPVPAPASVPALSYRESLPRPASLGMFPVRLGRRRPALLTALTTEHERGTAFLFVPVFMAAGAFSYFAVDREPTFAALGLAAAIAIVLTVLARSRLVLHLALSALLCFAFGMLFAKIETWRAGTKVLGGEISTVLTGRVAVIEHQASGRTRLTIDVLSTERPQLKYSPDRVRVSARAIPENLRAGEVVSGIVRLAAPSGPTRPGGYDFSFESYFDGIGASGFFLKGPERAADNWAANRTTRFFALVENLRNRLADRIRLAIGGAEGEIAAALVAGVRAGIPDDVNEALRRTGLAHVLSISGLHMALVAATIMFALRAGFALFPGFASRYPVKKYAAGAGLVALAVYLFLSGSAVAAERSFIMFGIMLLAVIFDRAALTMRNLAIAAIVIIALSPHEVVGPSFQMSFAATAALIGAYAAWSERRSAGSSPVHADHGLVRKVMRKTGGYVLALLTTSLIAGAATAVFGAYHFQRVSALGLAANLAAMPIVSVMVMPFALIGVILMPFGLDGWAFAVMGKGLAAMIAVAEWFSQMSPVDAVGMIPAVAVLVATAALIVATLPTTWLRVAAVPIALVAVLTISMRSLPDMLIAEDGRLVALRLDDGRMAVNRSRPSAFTSEDWQRALNADEMLKPKTVSADELAQPAPADMPGFRCSPEVCVAAAADGAMVVHALNGAAAKPFCTIATLIVIDDATAEHACGEGDARTVTKRDLARWGSASVTFAPGGDLRSAAVGFAIDEPYRPWHTQRAFSREARGLPPYERKKQLDAKPEADTAAPDAAPENPLNTAGSAPPAGPAP
jgi:ComEC/Rec2-related protein